MLKQRLSQKLLQKLSPQQIQMIKLLEIPTLQLEQRIKKEMEENPVLEEGEEDRESGEQEGLEEEIGKEKDNDQDQDEFSLEDYLNDEEIPSYRLSTKNYSKDERREDIPFSGGMSFHEHLETQLGLRDLTERQAHLAQYILGNIDEDGYLRRKLTAIVDDLAFTMNITTNEDELLEILKGPAGVPAASDRDQEPVPSRDRPGSKDPEIPF